MKAILGKYPGSRSKKQRKISVRVDPWDSWGADHTIAIIAVPVLEQLQRTKNGSPHLRDEEYGPNKDIIMRAMGMMTQRAVTDERALVQEIVNETVRPIDDKDLDATIDLTDEQVEHYTDMFHQVWDGVLSTIIYSLKAVCDDYLFNDPDYIAAIKRSDMKSVKQYDARVQEGLRLFGVYFSALWD